MRSWGGSISRLQDERLGFGHFLKRVANPFPTETAVLDSAVRLVIRTKSGRLVDQNTSDFEFLKRLPDPSDVSGK